MFVDHGYIACPGDGAGDLRELAAKIAQVLGSSAISMDIATPLDHRPGGIWNSPGLRKWHQDCNGYAWLMSIWSNIPSLLRTYPERKRVLLEPGHLYSFTNQDYEHRQPGLSPERYAQRYFVRVQRGVSGQAYS